MITALLTLALLTNPTPAEIPQDLALVGVSASALQEVVDRADPLLEAMAPLEPYGCGPSFSVTQTGSQGFIALVQFVFPSSIGPCGVGCQATLQVEVYDTFLEVVVSRYNVAGSGQCASTILYHEVPGVAQIVVVCDECGPIHDPPHMLLEGLGVEGSTGPDHLLK